MNSQKLQAAMVALHRVQAEFEHALADARHAIREAAEEAAGNEAEARSRSAVFYTERELAGALKVSEETLARLRREGQLPHLRLANLVRYTDEHVALIKEKFAHPKRRKPRAVETAEADAA